MNLMHNCNYNILIYNKQCSTEDRHGDKKGIRTQGQYQCGSTHAHGILAMTYMTEW